MLSAASAAASVTREREKERHRGGEGQAGGLFFSFPYFPYGAAQQKGARERCCLSRWRRQRERERGGPDRVGLEALAGRLSRRGGSTPPEGDFGARLTGGKKTGGRRAAGGVGYRCAGRGRSRRCGRGGGQGGRASVVPLSWAAPAARRVIASPGQASRVRPLLHTTPSGPTSPSWRSLARSVRRFPCSYRHLPLLDAAVSSGPAQVRIRSRMKRRLL